MVGCVCDCVFVRFVCVCAHVCVFAHGHSQRNQIHANHIIPGHTRNEMHHEIGVVWIDISTACVVSLGGFSLHGVLAVLVICVVGDHFIVTLPDPQGDQPPACALIRTRRRAADVLT